MSNTIFTRGKVNEVYYAVGKFQDDLGKRKFIHAPFDRLALDGAQYVMPRNSAEADGRQPAPRCSQVSVLDDEDNINREMFYLELNPIVRGAHEFGAHVAHPDDWVGVHRLDFI